MEVSPENKITDQMHENDEDELEVEMVPANDPYPLNASEITTSPPDFSDTEEIELPRGAAGDLLSCEDNITAHTDHIILDAIHKPLKSLIEEKEDPTIKKTRIFIEAIKKDGEWARTLENVKIAVQSNPYLTKDVLRDFLCHIFTKVNNRPKKLVVTSKHVTLADIKDMIQLVFASPEDRERAVATTVVRVFTKNTSPSLRKLAKCISDACVSLMGVEVECDEVYAELKRNGNVHKMKTDDLKSFFRMEDHCRALGCRVQASFVLRQAGFPFREVIIRWYDEFGKDKQTRVSYIHFDHAVRAENCVRVTFSDLPPTITRFDVDDDARMLPASLAGTSSTDLIAFLSKTMVGSHSL